MRFNYVYTLFTRYLDPYPGGLIIFDTLSQTDKSIYSMLNLSYHVPRSRRARNFGLEKIGHRIHNHDWMNLVLEDILKPG
jgi:hypothetical protein